MKRYNYYIGIALQEDIKFVTKINNSTRQASWSAGEKALAMPKSVAESVADALNMNFFPAFVIKAPTYIEFEN